MVAARKACQIEGCVVEPSVETRNENIKKVMIQFIRVMGLAKSSQEGSTSYLARGKGALNYVVTVFHFTAV
jgi:hypothetical protein